MIPPELRTEFEAPDADARRRAVLDLGRVPDAGTEGRGLLLRALGDVDWRVRKEAAGMLARAEATPELLQQELADKFREGLPVIMNLEAADREVSRRLIDFASGLCYGLNGSMEKVATGVYLLKPIHRPNSYDEAGYGG